jgi:hypothetical protein
VTLAVAGGLAINVNAIGGPGAPFELLSNSCGAAPFTLSPVDQCLLQLRVQPQAKGQLNSSLSFSSDAENNPLNLNLSVFGAPAAPQISPPLLSFGVVGINQLSSPQQAILTNNATVSLVLGSLGMTNGTAFGLDSDHCSGQTLASGASCDFSVRFLPEVAGLAQDSVMIPSDAVGSPGGVLTEGVGIDPLLFSDGFED